ncbi:MAG: ABC transporter substrate-binding protein [Burkholderiales bacterium]
MNNRRKLIVALGAGALTAPFGGLAQQLGKVWRVGFLMPRPRPASIDADYIGTFPRGMRELGYVEGKNLVIEWRFGDNNPERIRELAAELVRMKVDVLAAGGPLAAVPAQNASTTLPIVFVSVADPLGLGLIKSLARPGGNVTGLTSLTHDLGPKRLEMLQVMVPKASRVAYLVNAGNPSSVRSVESVLAAAQKLRLSILRVDVRAPTDIDAAFATMVREKVSALQVPLDPLFQQQITQIAQLALKHRLPCMSADQIYAEAGCLMSYGNSIGDDFHRAAYYVDKILKGAKPADLPVEQPTKFALYVNGKTAKTLGLTIPGELLIQAEKVIE